MVVDIMSISPKAIKQWNRIRPSIQNHTQLDPSLFSVVGSSFRKIKTYLVLKNPFKGNLYEKTNYVSQ
jgi:hypothetical protein